MNLERVIPQILAGTALFGVAVACRCPPTAPSGLLLGADNPAFAEIVVEAMAIRERMSCDIACYEAAPGFTGSWSCTFEGRIDAPSSVTCEPDEPDPGMAASTTLAIEVDDQNPWQTTRYPLVLGGLDCQDLCQSSASWADADAAGVEPAAIFCGPVQGATLDEIQMECAYGAECIGGRRPGVGVPCRTDGNAVGDWWAALAVLEHASIQAFEDLASTLTHHGAPHPFVERARQAAADERRHTRLALERARAHGCAVELEPVPASPPLPLEALARENALEGCVRETFAALEAHWQAEHAEDPDDRRVLAQIARDELRHGQLAWDLHAWMVEQGVVESAVLDAAFDGMASNAALPPGPAATALGIPPAEVRVRWLAQLRAAA
jgi:rubrerythrin